MKISPVNGATPAFCGLKRVVYKALATDFEKKMLAIKSVVGEGDKFVKSENAPLMKSVTRIINSKGNVVGLDNKFPDGSYMGMRVFPDGTIFDYRTCRYEDRLFGEKMGVKVHIINKKGYGYTHREPEAYRANGTQNLPSVRKLNEADKRNYREFMTKHYPALKDYLIDDLINI